jgi:hypothetical protein
VLEDIKFWLQISLISIGFAALTIASAVANAFVLIMIWRWYIAPYFSVPSLDMIHAFGLFLIVSLFTKKTIPGSKEDNASTEGVEHPVIMVIMSVIMNPPIALLIGWFGTIWLP